MCNGLPLSGERPLFFEAADADAAEQIARSAVEATPWQAKLCPMIRECHKNCLLIMQRQDAPQGQYEVDVLCENDSDCFAAERLQLDPALLTPNA